MTTAQLAVYIAVRCLKIERVATDSRRKNTYVIVGLIGRLFELIVAKLLINRSSGFHYKISLNGLLSTAFLRHHKNAIRSRYVMLRA